MFNFQLAWARKLHEGTCLDCCAKARYIFQVLDSTNMLMALRAKTKVLLPSGLGTKGEEPCIEVGRFSARPPFKNTAACPCSSPPASSFPYQPGTEVPTGHSRSLVQGHLVSSNTTSLFWLPSHPVDRLMGLNIYGGNIICAGSAEEFLILADWQTIKP